MSEPHPPEHPSEPAPPTGWRASKLFAWLQLFRAPNLLTVPGDPIAGFLLAAAATGIAAPKPALQMALAAAVSLMLYSAGLVWNDLFDLAEDRRQRPGRPLPSGRVRPGDALMVANALGALAIAVAAVAGWPTMWVAVALGLVVVAYDGALRRNPLLGPLSMGCCRGLSVLVGAAAFGGAGLSAPPVLAATGGITLYVTAVTWLARGETKARPVPAQRVAIALAMVVWLAAVAVGFYAVGVGEALWTWALLAITVVAMLWLVGSLVKLGGQPAPKIVQRVVGELIGGIVLVQAALVLTPGISGLGLASGLVGAFLLNRSLGKVFYAS